MYQFLKSALKFSVSPVGIHTAELVKILEVSGRLVIDLSALGIQSLNSLGVTLEVG